MTPILHKALNILLQPSNKLSDTNPQSISNLLEHFDIDLTEREARLVFHRFNKFKDKIWSLT